MPIVPLVPNVSSIITLTNGKKKLIENGFVHTPGTQKKIKMHKRMLDKHGKRGH